MQTKRAAGFNPQPFVLFRSSNFAFTGFYNALRFLSINPPKPSSKSERKTAEQGK
jgi:hypothetical protein